MIETTITKIQYNADGVQRRWSIPFPYADVKHISIYTKVGDEPTVKVVDNYDIDEDDSVVIYPTVPSGQEPLAAGTKITIARETPETQLEDASQLHFTSKDVERGLDKLTMITQELSATAGETMEVSAAAFEAAEEAVSTANEADKKADNAVIVANNAKSVADGIDAKATQALTNSNTAVNTANSAKQTAEAVDGKATQALANSATALETANQAKTTADSFQGQITTLRNDVDDLGDQVAAIEGKIPAEATTANQLADKEFVTTITDELAADITALDADVQNINLIKWVQALPTTGETKYLYAIPRNEVDKDGKKIVALYLWDGTQWRGAGGTSIDPGISEGDGIKGDYCTTYGIIDAPNGILTNPSGMEVVLKQGVVLQLAGQDIKTTISGDLTHTITSTADCDLFYVSGTTSLMEVAQIVWSRIEPDNGQAGVLAWWNPSNKKWKFKSNDTGNVWAEAVATPVAHIHTNGTTITRIDHIGFRVLDDEVYALKSDLSLSKRPLGEVYFSQSSLATDNPGALPGWTGEYYENGKTLFPDLYNFVKADSTRHVTKEQYDNAIAIFGECPKYVVDENTAQTSLRLPKYQKSGRYLVKREVNGSDWYYSLYSDGWLEQGGYFKHPDGGGIGTATITLPVEMASSNYQAIRTADKGGKENESGSRWVVGINGNTRTTTSFAFFYDQVALAIGDFWEVKGYAAGTPVENIKYPWISAYTSAIPASVAQAAQFTNALSGKANTDLSNVLANIDYVVESKVPTESDPRWCKKYKSGWLEQGGIAVFTDTTDITLLKPFANTLYTGNVTEKRQYGSAQRNCTFQPQSGSVVRITSGLDFSESQVYWEAKGMGA